MRKISLLMLVFSLGLSAKIWVNAIRDPGAELGQGDWKAEKLGVADSARVSAHDSSRAYEGKFSFLTDTDKDPRINNAQCLVWCYQDLKVPKAIKDMDSCFWMICAGEKDKERVGGIGIRLYSLENKRMLWFIGSGSAYVTDTVCYLVFPLPDSGIWTNYKDDIEYQWTETAQWSELDSIVKIEILSQGWKNIYWYGQEVSWDNIVLRSVAYYDYAAKSIDSDVPSGGKYTPVVTFANEGIKADKDAWAYAEILEGSTKVYIDSQKVSIPKESSKQVTFTEWSVAGGDPFTLRVYPILDLDELSSDDTLEKSLGGVNEGEGVVAVEPLRISQTPSGVEFSFAPGISGELSVYDASGRKVFARSITTSTSNLRWSTSTVPSGLYFARFKSPTYSSSEKFLVIH